MIKLQSFSLSIALSITFPVTLPVQAAPAFPPHDRDTPVENEAEVRNPRPPGWQVDFIDKNLSAIRSLCRNQKNNVMNIGDVHVLCHHGSIRDIDQTTKNRRNYSFAYINSNGGDILSAFSLGREIFNNKAYVIVDESCHSACGSYIIPSSRRLYVADGAVISTHTTIPRTRVEFVSVRYKNEMDEFREEMKGGLLGQSSTIKLASLLNEYDSFFDEFVLAELEFFKAINKDTAFALRHREVYRSLKRRSDYSCSPDKGLHLIIGPQYLDEFKIKTVRSWVAPEKSQIVKSLGAVPSTDVLIYDFDDHPFWVPGRGLVTPQDCVEAPQ